MEKLKKVSSVKLDMSLNATVEEAFDVALKIAVNLDRAWVSFETYKGEVLVWDDTSDEYKEFCLLEIWRRHHGFIEDGPIGPGFRGVPKETIAEEKAIVTKRRAALDEKIAIEKKEAEKSLSLAKSALEKDLVDAPEMAISNESYWQDCQEAQKGSDPGMEVLDIVEKSARLVQKKLENEKTISFEMVDEAIKTAGLSQLSVSIESTVRNTLQKAWLYGDHVKSYWV